METRVWYSDGWPAVENALERSFIVVVVDDDIDGDRLC